MNEAYHNICAHGSPKPDGDDQTKARKRSLSGGRSGSNKRFRGEDESEGSLVEEWTRFRRKLTDDDERRIFRRAEKEVERERRERKEARKQKREKGGNEDETGEAKESIQREEKMDYDSSSDQRVSDKLKSIEEEFQRYWDNWKRQYEQERMELALRSNGYHAAKSRTAKPSRDIERRHEEERPIPRSSRSQESQRDHRSSSRERHKRDTEPRDQGRTRVEEDRPKESTVNVKIENDRSPSRGESRTTRSSSYDEQAAKPPPLSEDDTSASSATMSSESSGKVFPFRYRCPLCQVVLNSVKQKEEHLTGKKHRSALVVQASQGTLQTEPHHSPLKSSAPKAQSSHQRLSPMGGKPATKQALSDMIQECKLAALSGQLVSVKPEPTSGEEGPALIQLKSRSDSEPPSAQIRTAAARADLSSLSTPEHLDLDLNLVEPTGDKASVSAEPPAIPPGQVRVKEERGQTSFNSPSTASKPKVVNLFGVQVLVLDEEDQPSGEQAEQRVSSKEAKGKQLESAEDSEEVSDGESDEEDEDDEYEGSEEGEEDEDDEEMEMLSSDESTDFCEFSDEEESGAKNDDEDEELKRVKEERRKLLASLSVTGGRQTCKKIQQYIATKRNLPPWMLTPEERRVRWEAKYAQAKQFFSEHGRMPKQKESGLLWNWMRHAQTHWHKLDADQVEKLSALGVKPVKPRVRPRGTTKAEKASTKKPKTSTAAEPTRKKKKRNAVDGDWFVWDSRLRELAEYRTATNGHNPPYFVPVGRWLYEQIAMQNRGLLKPERKAALEKLGVQWDFQEEATARGPMSEGKRTETKSAPRSNTTQTSAETATKETVKKERKKRVDWARSYQELVEYLKQNKGKDPPKGSQLEKWLRRQRYRISKGQLAETRTAMLSALGVIPSHLINTQQAIKSEKATETKPKEETTKPAKRTPSVDAAPDSSSSEAVSPYMRELLRRIRSSQQ